MAKLRDALKYLGTKVNGVEPKGHYVTDIIKSIADDYQGGEPTERVTLTYALGDYATGSVPEAVTVDAGETVQIDFETVPSYDGSGKFFVGWAETDGAESPTYIENGSNEITMNENVTLYPVFADMVTLTYAMGAYADGGSVPSPVTAQKYEDVSVEFGTHPTRDGYSFVGWATTDGASVAEYYEDMYTPTIHLTEDTTLYPVFAAQGGNDPSITINNQSGGDVAITDSSESVLYTVANGNSDSFTLNSGESYKIRIPSSCNSSLNGTYKGVQYNDESMTSHTHEGYDWIDEPTSGQQSTYWEPTIDDDFTISVTGK